MKAFVTGANGFIGARLVKKLVNEGYEVNVLLRNTAVFRDFTYGGIRIIYGDLFASNELKTGMEGCDYVFHLAAYAKPSSRDPSLPYKINVEGTANVLNAARQAGVSKIIVTSTAGTMSYSRDGSLVSETTNINPAYHTDYEKTKAESEKQCSEMAREGMDIVIVNPSRVFGPGKLTKSNSITRIMMLYGKGLWRIVPGNGEAVGNYAYINDVIDGYLRAAKHGRSGERYILGGENISFNNLFDALGHSFGKKRIMLKLSSSGMKRIAQGTGFFLKLAGRPSLITPDWIDKYLMNWSLSCNKAVAELSYSITPFNEAIDETVRWLKTGEYNE
ncbi:MAG TPA: NAD-dependent epimerase/dehydratase family protein [Bacteroidales bacterium]|nr:NAD-dependent epimerase/dehydratase family protein [Bacteroidales bacterium]